MTLGASGVDGLLDYLLPDHARRMGRAPRSQPPQDAHTA